jgi:hypothetical protein
VTVTRKFNFDLDGVIFDFYGTAERILGAPYKSLPPAVTWGKLQQIDHFFEHLPLLEDALHLWQGAEKLIGDRGERRILTAVPRPTGKLWSAPCDKIVAVRKHISATAPVIIVPRGELKALHAAPGDVLIDDLQRNIDAWVAAGGIGILHRSARETLEQLNEYALLQTA